MAYVQWLQASHTRVFPSGNTTGPSSLTLDVARNEQVAFQACISDPHGDAPEQIGVTVSESDGLQIRVRKLGFVPMPHPRLDPQL